MQTLAFERKPYARVVNPGLALVASAVAAEAAMAVRRAVVAAVGVAVATLLDGRGGAGSLHGEVKALEPLTISGKHPP